FSALLHSTFAPICLCKCMRCRVTVFPCTRAPRRPLPIGQYLWNWQVNHQFVTGFQFDYSILMGCQVVPSTISHSVQFGRRVCDLYWLIIPIAVAVFSEEHYRGGQCSAPFSDH